MPFEVKQEELEESVETSTSSEEVSKQREEVLEMLKNLENKEIMS